MRIFASGRSARARLALLAAAGALPLLPAAGAGQTPFTAIGFGYPTVATDARAAALGSAGVALLGGTYSLINPAGVTDFRGLSINLSLTPEQVSVKFPDASEGIRRAWVPVARAIIPLASNTSLAFGIGADLNQNWGVVFSDTLESTLGTFPFDERRENDGGLSSLDGTLARRIGPISVGVGVQRLIGNLRQTVARLYQPDTAGSGRQLLPVRDFGEVSYTAWRFLGGAMASFENRFRVGASFGVSTDLDATNDTTGVTVSFDMPATAALGASVRVTPRLLLAASGIWQNWSATNRSFSTVRTADSYQIGGGLEYIGTRFIGLGVPLRLGYRWAKLPFIIRDKQQSTEWAVTLGFGAALASGLANFDFGFDIGSRGDLETTGAEESFFRSTLSISLRQ